MNFDHVLIAASAFVGGLLSQLAVAPFLVPFLRKHFGALYRSLNEVRAKLDMTPIPFKDSDLEPEPITGSWRIPRK